MLLVFALAGCATEPAPAKEEPLMLHEKVPGQDRGVVLVTVVDAKTGVPLSASVVVTALHLGFERMGDTDGAGNFQASSLPFGDVTVRVAAPGYQPYSVDDVHVENDVTTHVDVRLMR